MYNLISQSDFGKMDGDHRFFLLSSRFVSGHQVREQKWVLRGRYSLPRVQNRVGHVHRSPMDLTSLKTFSCIFIRCVFRGQRAELLELHRLSAPSHSLLLAIKVSIFWALFGDTPKVPVPPRAGATPANSAPPGRGRGCQPGWDAQRHCNDNKLACQRGGQICY